MMRRIVATALACVLLLGSCAFSEGAEVFSYDFNLHFSVNPAAFPFRLRQRAQGYADLFDMLEFRGNISWCPETEGVDLQVEMIPRTNPASAVSFRIYGIPSVRRVTSPLFGNEAACYYPPDLMRSALMIRDTFQVPLPSLLLVNPEVTSDAFSCLVDAWNVYAGDLSRGGTVPVSTLYIIANCWAQQLETNVALNNWISAVVGPLKDDGATEAALESLPEMLLGAAKESALTVTVEGDTQRCMNRDGFVLWEETNSDTLEEYILKVPEDGLDAVPSYTVRKETADGKINYAMNLRWDKAESAAAEDGETEDRPAPRLGLHIGVNGLPETLPADSSFTGELSQDGYIMPEFSLLLQGSTAADGKVALALTYGDNRDAGAVFACEGTITPAVHEEPLEYEYDELKTDYNLFILSYSTQRGFIEKIKKPFIYGLIEFLYELPVSSCQSIMDDLEEYGILATALN